MRDPEMGPRYTQSEEELLDKWHDLMEYSADLVGEPYFDEETQAELDVVLDMLMNVEAEMEAIGMRRMIEGG